MATLTVTGDFSLSREQIFSKFKDLGINCEKSLKKNVSVLVIGDNGKDSKIYEALLNNITVVDKKALDVLLKMKKPITLEEFNKHIAPFIINDASKGVEKSAVLRKRKREINYSEISLFPSLKYQKKRDKSSSISSTSSNIVSNKQKRQPHGKVIALEGLIGIGKSTLCNKLKSLYPRHFEIYREETNEKFLKLFYSDPKKYGFSLQWGMLKSRIYQLRLAQHDTKHHRIPKRDLYLWDRSMIGDYTFALLNHLLGGLSIEEMDAYESEFGGSIMNIENLPFLSDIHLFVWLNDEPSECKYRLENMRMNESEQGIPLSYYESLDDIHFFVFTRLLMSNKSKVFVQSWGEYDDPKATKAIYQNILSNRRKLPVMETKMIPEETKEIDLIYSSEDDIIKAYEKIKVKDTVEYDKTKYNNIYIPSNIMIIDPSEKNMNNELCEKYGIKLYKNEYKRVILWHLSKFQNVYLYDL